MENTKTTSYTAIYTDWNYRSNLSLVDLKTEKNVLCFIRHTYSRSTESGKNHYYKNTIVNESDTETTLQIGTFTLQMNSEEYWLKYDEDTDDYTHFNRYKNVNPSFIYPLNQEVKCIFLGKIIYKFNGLSNEEKERIKKADENSKGLVKLQNEMRWMGKCCSIKISTATGSNEGRLFLQSGFATTFVGFCKDLSLSENIPDWKAKQLVDILAPHLEKLRAEINDLDQEDIKLAYTDIENIAKKFNFYLSFMKKRGVNIAEYLQLLESKM